MKNVFNEKLEQDLNIFSAMKEIGAPDFFYTRLNARMEEEYELPIKPIWVIGALSLFLFINTLLLEKDKTSNSINSVESIEAFAAAYDQHISN